MCKKCTLLIQINPSNSITSEALFIWEGVSQYISKEANDSILKYVVQAAPDSKIVFSYILRNFIEGKNIHEGIRTMYKWMVKRFSIWIYGMDPAEIGDHLSKYSLPLIEDIGSEEVQERYMKLVNLDLKVFEIERLALAEVKK